jgi:hypothetical protein
MQDSRKIRRSKPKSRQASSVRTNVYLNPQLVRSIASNAKLKSQRAVVDFALKTTADLLEKRKSIGRSAAAVCGITRDSGIFPQGYAATVRGR